MTLTIDEAAARAGASCWIERRLFEVLGAWSADASGAETTLVLDRHSLHAAWRAAQWWDRLPVLAGVEREGLVVAPARWGRLLGCAGAEPPAADGDVARLAVAYRVALPRLVAGYRAHAAMASPVSDGPALRTLARAGDDARSDWEEGEARLQATLAAPGDVDGAAEAVRRAELALVAGG